VVTVTPEGDRLVARAGDGEVLCTVEHPSGRFFGPVAKRPHTAFSPWPEGEHDDILFAANTVEGGPMGTPMGELFYLSGSGEVLWTRSVDESLRFGEREYPGPWVSSFLYSPRPASDVVIWGVHDGTWWPSLTMVLMEDGSVAGKFVNSGWILSAGLFPTPDGDRVLLGGISNSRAGAMLAVLPGLRFFGRPPEVEGSAFVCDLCPDGQPLMYVVFPPTHVNVASGLPYNQTTHIDMSIAGASVTVQEGPIGTDFRWVYDFSPDFELLRATPGDSYWPLHQLLEMEGKLDHSAEDCPERESVEVLVWTPEGGWNATPTKTGAAPGRDEV